ncbi:hypothetical protein HGP14_30675 [Rhizobium sp. P32RR-XVIII]|uniref:hypothetical protein n=1 Tax=Rhizobium sp. P32RR-XVIII TaxID=2726738 RepID=UPI00145701AA|nr:hypothetical protein [Rhizobium sp. P32RR-XVIII]NLS07631.1 hypothetical protein [Rhizobium sp. P32RR-XVIII]
MMQEQLDLFAWADSRPSAIIIDLTPIIVRLMPAVDPVYEKPAQVIRPSFRSDRKRGAA